MVKIVNWMCFNLDQLSKSTLGFMLINDQRSRSTLEFILIKINGQDRLLDAFWPWSTVKIIFGIYFDMINNLDRLLEAFWPWSTVKIDFTIWSRSMVKIDLWMHFDQGQWSRLTLECVLTMINGQDWLLDVFW